MKRARLRPRGRRLGLALAGGGPEGAIYEIGALRALEESIEGLDLNEVDVYVGVSAGAFVAAFLANGVSISQMVRALVKHQAGEHPFVPQTFFTPAYREWTRRAALLPLLLADALFQLARQPQDETLFGSLTRLARALPLGIFDNEPIRRYLARSFAIHGRSDDFRKLRHLLVVVSADLASGKAVRFGEPGLDHVPISTAVQASTALPGIYPPVSVDGMDCVDGVLLRTVHASVALEAGADLLLCVNPIVPADLSAAPPANGLSGMLRRRGLPTVMSQTFRTMIHSRLQVGMATYARRFPEADVLLFEPARDEYRMFFTNTFRLSTRREVCELAYQSTRRDLRRRKAQLEPLLERRGLRLRTDLLDDETRTVWEGVGLAAPQKRSAVGSRLNRALAVLEAPAGR
jgi:predicted acylesterase/phospholipase RssA